MRDRDNNLPSDPLGSQIWQAGEAGAVNACGICESEAL